MKDPAVCADNLIFLAQNGCAISLVGQSQAFGISHVSRDIAMHHGSKLELTTTFIMNNYCGQELGHVALKDGTLRWYISNYLCIVA